MSPVARLCSDIANAVAASDRSLLLLGAQQAAVLLLMLLRCSLSQNAMRALIDRRLCPRLLSALLEGRIDGRGMPVTTPTPLSAPLCDMLKRMLNHSPADRLTATEALRHPWIMGEGQRLLDRSEVIHQLQQLKPSEQGKQRRNTKPVVCGGGGGGAAGGGCQQQLVGEGGLLSPRFLSQRRGAHMHVCDRTRAYACMRARTMCLVFFAGAEVHASSLRPSPAPLTGTHPVPRNAQQGDRLGEPNAIA